MKTLMAFVVSTLVPSLALAALEFSPPARIPGTENATRVRIKAGANGDVHMAYVVPAQVRDASVTAARVYYARYRNGEWSAPLLITEPETSTAIGLFANVAGDSRGNGYVTWIEQNRNHWFVTVTDARIAKAEVRPAGGRAIDCKVIVDRNDRVCVIRRSKTPVDANWLLTRPAGASEWESEIRLTAESPEGQRQANLCPAPDGTLHYGYRWMAGGGADRRLGYRTYDAEAKQWSEPALISGAGGKPWGPEMAVDAAGGLHMVFAQGYAPNFTIAYRAPNGEVKDLGGGSDGEFGFPPTIAITPSGEIVIVQSSSPQSAEAAATGTVTFLAGTSEGFAPARSVAEGDAPRGWGCVCATPSLVIMTWVQGNVIHYRVAASLGPRP